MNYSVARQDWQIYSPVWKDKIDNEYTILFNAVLIGYMCEWTTQNVTHVHYICHLKSNPTLISKNK
jgi:hypothetical protein